jgi:hypothetical protein
MTSSDGSGRHARAYRGRGIVDCILGGTAALLKSLAFSCPVLADFLARLAMGDRITVTLFDPFSANRNCRATFVSSMRATSSYIRVNLVNP